MDNIYLTKKKSAVNENISAHGELWQNSKGIFEQKEQLSQWNQMQNGRTKNEVYKQEINRKIIERKERLEELIPTYEAEVEEVHYMLYRDQKQLGKERRVGMRQLPGVQ